jgi:hypothetical protein
LIEELDEEGFPGASPSRPAAGNLDKHRRHPAAARRDSGPTDPSKSPACNSLAPNGHRSPSSRQLGQLSGAQVSISGLDPIAMICMRSKPSALKLFLCIAPSTPRSRPAP